MKARYMYHGPAVGFGRLLMSAFDAETVASSDAEARKNFEYQFKKKANLSPTAKVTLPGKIVMLEKIMD